MEGIRYSPNPPPSTDSAAEVASWLYDELVRIGQVLDARADGQHEVRHTLPDKPRRGMLVYLTGEDDDPTGDGEGFYVYLGGDWRRVDTSG